MRTSKKASEINTTPTIWIAKRQSDGRPIGYLIARGGRILVFVRASDALGLRVAMKVLARRNCIRDGRVVGVRVDDFFDSTFAGPHIDLPAFLFGCFFLPVDIDGFLTVPKESDCASICITNEKGSTNLRCLFELRKWFEPSEMPAWLREIKATMRKPGKAKQMLAAA